MAQVKQIAVLVSGGGTNLQALIDAERRGELGCGKISLVIASKPDVYALERARINGIESIVLARKEYADIAAYSRALTDTLVAEHIDLVVLAGFLTIIDEQVYNRFPNRILNVHGSESVIIPTIDMTEQIQKLIGNVEHRNRGGTYILLPIEVYR